jgi:hypothetical protein
VKVVVKTDEYTIYQRRDERYAVKDATKAWVNGDAKAAILVQHELITAALPAAPLEEPEADAGEPAAEAAAAEEVTGAEESAAEESEPAEAAAPAEEAAAAEVAAEDEAGEPASAEEGEEEPKPE